MSFSGTKGYITKPKPGVMLNPLHPLSRGLVGYWLFNEGSGSKADDISGSGNHGILTGMSPNAQDSGWSSSKFGGGLMFDGTNSCVDCGNDKSLDITDAITITAWVYPIDCTTYHAIVGRGYYLDSYWLALQGYGSNKLLFYIEDVINYETSVSYLWSNNKWQYITVTYDSNITTNNLNIYIDGDLIESSTQTGTIGAPVSSLLIGDSTYNFSGHIDSVYVYNRALSAEEIKQLYLNPFCNLLQVPIRRYSVTAPPVGVIINQFQRANIGADLYNGVFT